MTSRGVPAGAISAYQDTASKRGMPCSAMVGVRQGGGALQAGDADARSLPLLMKRHTDDICANIMLTWPPSKSLSAGPVPLYGTCSSCTPPFERQQLAGQVGLAAGARRGEADRSGFCRASASSSLRLAAGSAR
jgi:hypothetical protein